MRRTHPRFILWQHDLAWTTDRYRHELFDGYPWDFLRTDWPEAFKVVVSRLAGMNYQVYWDFPGRIRVIPNGMDVPQFLKLAEQTKFWPINFTFYLPLLSYYFQFESLLGKTLSWV